MIVKKEKTDEEMELLKNTKIRKDMIKTIITSDTDVYTEEGKLLLRYKRGIIKGGQEYYKNVKPFMDKHPSTNRGSASGGTEMNVKDNPKVKTAIIGYFDKWSPKQKYLFKSTIPGSFPDRLPRDVSVIYFYCMSFISKTTVLHLYFFGEYCTYRL